MTSPRYLYRVADIKTVVAPRELEMVYATENIEIHGEYLYFNYRHGDHKGLRNILCSEDGIFWIGKNYCDFQFICDFFWSHICNSLESPSPEVRFLSLPQKYPRTDFKDSELKKLIIGPSYSKDLSHAPYILVPRMLSGRVPEARRDSIRSMELDINLCNFIVDLNGNVHQLDFPNETLCFLNYIANRWSKYGLIVSPEDQLASSQIDKLREEPAELIFGKLQERILSVTPQRLRDGDFNSLLRMVEENFLWNYHNIEQILTKLSEHQHKE